MTIDTVNGLVAKVLEGDDLSAEVLTDLLLEQRGYTLPCLSGTVTLMVSRAGSFKGNARPALVSRCVFAYVVPGKSIELFGTRRMEWRSDAEPARVLDADDAQRHSSVKKGSVGYYFSRRFEVGDECVTGSFNLIYTDPVAAITAKTVSTSKGYGYDKPRMKRFDLESFCSMNWDCNLEEIAERNAITSQSI